MPYYRDSFDLSNQYQTVRVNKILRESYQNDLVRVANLMHNDPVLCNEIFGQLGQKVKQGVQAGAQAVQAKLIQPIINLIMSKLPEETKQQVTQAAQQGPEALQQYLQKNGDANVSNQLTQQPEQGQAPAQGKSPAQTPAAESVNRELGNLFTLLSVLTTDAAILTEAKMSDRGKFTNFQRTLNQIASEITDPAIKQQAQSLASYIQQNYSQRGKAKNKQAAPAPQQAAPAPQQAAPAPQQAAPAPQQAAPAPQQASPDYSKKPNPSEPAPQQQQPQQPSGFMSKLAKFGKGASSFLGKVGSYIKENPNLSTAGALGLMLAVTAATGGTAALLPFVLAAGKAAAIGAASSGAIKGGTALLQGKGFKQAGQEALSGAKTGARFGAVGGAAGNLVSNIMKNVSKPPEQVNNPDTDASNKEIEDNMAYTKKNLSDQHYNINEPRLNSAIKAIKGKDNFGNVLTHRDTEWAKKLEDATGQDDPDAYLKFLGNSASSGNEEAKRELLGLLKQAGPMPKADFDQLSKDYGLDDNQKMAFIKLFKVRDK
jgi:hypothetical protein